MRPKIARALGAMTSRFPVGRFIPARIRHALSERFRYADYRAEQLRREAQALVGGAIPVASDPSSTQAGAPRVGIFSDTAYSYVRNVMACRELGVPFQVVDLLAEDWVERVEASGCAGFMATPSHLLRSHYAIQEERLWAVHSVLKRPLFPTFAELYLWESKRRMADWLVANRVPHPPTWVFSDEAAARRFVDGASFPMAFKTDAGGVGQGVKIVRNQRQASRLIDKAFGSGVRARSSDARNVERDYILFQDYVSHRHEWRLVRIGDSYLCRRKLCGRDGFASGSGRIEWAEPSRVMLDFARDVTTRVGFRCMTLDMFENPAPDADDPFLINELQTIVGFRDVPATESTGRWRFDHDAGTWTFERGEFHQNVLANLRLRAFLEELRRA